MMSRRTEQLERLPARPDDCFAQFDAVFNTLATQLGWPGARPELVVPLPFDPSPETNDHTSLAAGEAAVQEPSTEFLVERQIVVESDGGQATAPGAYSPQLDEAFDKLDSELARSDCRTAPMALPKRAITQEAEPPVFEVDSQWFREAGLEPEPGASGMIRPATPGPARVVPFEAAVSNGDGDDEFEQDSSGGWTPLPNLLRLLENLLHMQGRLDANDRTEKISREAMSGLFAHARQVCLDLDLRSASVRVDFALEAIDRGHAHKVSGEIEELIRHIRHDLQFCFVCSTRRSSSTSPRANARPRLLAR